MLKCKYINYLFFLNFIFEGIDPKLEFSSNSTIQETTVPGTYRELTSVSVGDDDDDDESASDSQVIDQMATLPISRFSCWVSQSCHPYKKNFLNPVIVTVTVLITLIVKSL